MLSVDHADISSFTTSGSAVFNNESRLTQDLHFKQRKKTFISRVRQRFVEYS